MFRVPAVKVTRSSTAIRISSPSGAGRPSAARGHGIVPKALLYTSVEQPEELLQIRVDPHSRTAITCNLTRVMTNDTIITKRSH